MGCRRCGQCCNKAVLILEGHNMALAKNRDVAQWYSHHHCDVKVDSETGDLAIFIPLVCKHLNYDTKSGISHCMIYETRPQICRDYLCEAAEKDNQ